MLDYWEWRDVYESWSENGLRLELERIRDLLIGLREEDGWYLLSMKLGWDISKEKEIGFIFI